MEALRRGTDVVFRLDIQGAQTMRRKFPDAVTIFLVSLKQHLGRLITCTLNYAYNCVSDHGNVGRWTVQTQKML